MNDVEREIVALVLPWLWVSTCHLLQHLTWFAGLQMVCRCYRPFSIGVSEHRERKLRTLRKASNVERAKELVDEDRRLTVRLHFTSLVLRNRLWKKKKHSTVVEGSAWSGEAPVHQVGEGEHIWRILQLKNYIDAIPLVPKETVQQTGIVRSACQKFS